MELIKMSSNELSGGTSSGLKYIIPIPCYDDCTDHVLCEWGYSFTIGFVIEFVY
jgi:hypothetical protein